MEQGSITIHPVESDYIDIAQFGHRRQWRKNRRANIGFMSLFGALGLVVIASDLQHGRAPVQGLIFCGVIALSFGLIAFNYYVSIPNQMRKAFRQRKYPNDTHVEWDGARIVFEDPVTRITAPWPEMTCWYEDPKLFVLDFRGRPQGFLPKHCFPDAAAVDAFRRLLGSKIGPQGVVRK